MANQSTTGPSGIGSEVLRRKALTAANNTESTLLTVGTDMIVTVLSVIYTNMQSVAKKFDLKVAVDGAGGTAHQIARAPSVEQYETYVFNEKFVLTETDVLKCWSDSTSHDVYVSYIEQEFE